jgi:inhibitor of KinA
LVWNKAFCLSDHSRLLALVDRLDAVKPPYVFDVVPGHNEILVTFDAGDSRADDLAVLLEQIANEPFTSMFSRTAALLHVAVCFDSDFGLDLAAMATRLSMPEARLVEAFTAPVYQCTVVGFRPGFPYLEGLPEELALPRHASPRAHVPRGSVAVAGGQAGIYPVDGPGGWHVLGRTAVALFTPTQSPPCLISPGTRVQFHAIDRKEFLQAHP